MKTANRIKTVVAKEFDLPLSALNRRDRHARLKLARSTAMYFIRTLTPCATLELVGRCFGRTPYLPSTVKAAVESIQEMSKGDPAFIPVFEAIKRRLAA